MIEALQICRICLSVNVRMFLLKKTNMENMYKLLSQVDDIDEVGKPTTVCFLCYARLRQCNRLQQQAIKSNELLKQFLRDRFTHATAKELLNNQYSSQDLQITSTYFLNLDPAHCEDVLLDPKVEANDQILLKKEEETIDEGINLTDLNEDTKPFYFSLEAVDSYSEDNQQLKSIGSNKCDRIKDITQGVEWRTQEKEENPCIIKTEKEVKSDPCPFISTQIQQKDNNKEAKQVQIKYEINLERKNNSIIIKLEKIQNTKNYIVDDRVDIKTEEKIEKKEANIEPKKQNIEKPTHNENTESENMNDTKATIINSITDECQREECDKEFSSKDILADHILSCKKISEYLPSVSHLMEANTNTNKKYRCHICTFQTNQKRVIVTHLKMHSVTKVFTCDICGYRCVHRNYFKNHMLIHTGDKPFSCNICEFRSVSKYNLKDHMRIHSGEKPFSCSFCGYRCAYKHHLRDHMIKHTGEKPFSCNICDYKCIQKHHLKYHKRTHTGEKPFSCNICEYRCIQNSQLKRHIKTHIGKESFSCNICEYRCTKMTILNAHLKTHKREDTKTTYCQ